MQRLPWWAGLYVGLRQAAIFIDREGTFERNPNKYWVSTD
jgi:hypothetical protein